MVRRIVLTGGPGAGKTHISAQIAASYPDQIVLVPEAATQVYTAMQTRWDLLDADQQRSAQRRIYHFQIEQETRAAEQHPDKILLLDRGTVDGATYWPQGPTDYWAQLNTSLDSELARYDLVIWLQTAAAIGQYNMGLTNACRFEDAAAAIESGARLEQQWGRHRAFYRVDAQKSIGRKVAAVEAILVSALKTNPNQK
jgi:predicted ATPase